MCDVATMQEAGNLVSRMTHNYANPLHPDKSILSFHVLTGSPGFVLEKEFVGYQATFVLL